jgi:hypothetical protein
LFYKAGYSCNLTPRSASKEPKMLLGWHHTMSHSCRHIQRYLYERRPSRRPRKTLKQLGACLHEYTKLVEETGPVKADISLIHNQSLQTPQFYPNYHTF